MTLRNSHWLLLLLTLSLTSYYFFSYAMNPSSGPFGTFNLGPVVLQHEGIGLGIISAATFFYRNKRVFGIMFLIGSALVASEYFINNFKDFISNPFGIFFSSVLGFVYSFAIIRGLGLHETKGLIG